MGASQEIDVTKLKHKLFAVKLVVVAGVVVAGVVAAVVFFKLLVVRIIRVKKNVSSCLLSVCV